MKPIIEFYAKLVHFFQEDYEVEGYANEIIELAKKAQPTLPEITSEYISLLEKCVNHSDEVDDEYWLETKEEFVCGAFKDLTAIREKRAMDLFYKVQSLILPDVDGDLFVWNKKIKSRPDGSAIIVLHVSNEEYFNRMLSGIGYEGDLDEGALFRSAGYKG